MHNNRVTQFVVYNQRMDPDAILAKGKAEIVKELNIGHFSQPEQDMIIEKLGEYLMRRVLTKMFDSVTAPEDKAAVEKMIAQDKFLEVRGVVEKYIPDVDGMVKSEAHDGMDEYKRNLEEAIAKEAAAKK